MLESGEFQHLLTELSLLSSVLRFNLATLDRALVDTGMSYRSIMIMILIEDFYA